MILQLSILIVFVVIHYNCVDLTDLYRLVQEQADEGVQEEFRVNTKKMKLQMSLIDDDNKEELMNVFEEFCSETSSFLMNQFGVEMEPLVLALALDLDKVVEYYVLEKQVKVDYHHLLYFDWVILDGGLLVHRRWLHDEFEDDCEKMHFYTRHFAKQLYYGKRFCLHKYDDEEAFFLCGQSEAQVEKDSEERIEWMKETFPSSYIVNQFHNYFLGTDPSFIKLSEMINFMITHSNEDIEGFDFDVLLLIMEYLTPETYQFIKRKYFPEYHSHIIDYNLLHLSFTHTEVNLVHSVLNLIDVLPGKEEFPDLRLVRKNKSYLKIFRHLGFSIFELRYRDTCILAESMLSPIQSHLINLYSVVKMIEMMAGNIMGQPLPKVCDHDRLMMENLNLFLTKAGNLIPENGFEYCGNDQLRRMEESILEFMLSITVNSKEDKEEWMPLIHFFFDYLDRLGFLGEDKGGKHFNFDLMGIMGHLYMDTGNALIHEVVGSQFFGLLELMVDLGFADVHLENLYGWQPVYISFANEDKDIGFFLLSRMEEEERMEFFSIINQAYEDVVDDDGDDDDDDSCIEPFDLEL